MTHFGLSLISSTRLFSPVLSLGHPFSSAVYASPSASDLLYPWTHTSPSYYYMCFSHSSSWHTLLPPRSHLSMSVRFIYCFSSCLFPALVFCPHVSLFVFKMFLSLSSYIQFYDVQSSSSSLFLLSFSLGIFFFLSRLKHNLANNLVAIFIARKESTCVDI